MMTPTFPAWLRRELKQRDWTQAYFARRVGTSSGVVSHWARGTRVPSPDSCDLIADALGADLDYVLTLVGHRPTGGGDDDPETMGLIRMIRQVRWTKERRRYIRSLLEDMRDFDRAGAAG